MRSAFYSRLAADNIELRKLAVNDRLLVIYNGLSDVDPTVKDACVNYLRSQLNKCKPWSFMCEFDLVSCWDHLKMSQVVNLMYSKVFSLNTSGLKEAV